MLNIIQSARYVIGLTWIYHGLFPKLLQVAPLEQTMTGSLGFSDEHTYMLIKAAGVGEVIFGLAFILFYRITFIQVLNLVGLIGLLVFASVVAPFSLMAAFNPVTTNVPLILLGCALLQHTVTVSEKKL
ncbi:DoxX-like family protein [Vibrio neptunius]|uniref:DoxX-like family protein n=1 Tax=Vibrio neptunius TaxID=170651 RepID=UPI00214EFD7A|nr:DoxX-like family protein [Vibrio neptunius]